MRESVCRVRVEGRGGLHGGRTGGGGGGGHKSRHIIVTHQPKGSNKGRHAVLSPVLSVSPASSLGRQKDEERDDCDPFAAHPRRQTHKTCTHTEREVQTVPQLQKTLLPEN